MTERLDVNAGETYTVSAGDTEEWLGADVDGVLDVQGTLKLIDDADPPTDEQPAPGGIDLDRGIDLPLSIRLPMGPLNLSNMEIGTSFLLVGILTVLGGAAAVFKNYAAGVSWSFAFVILILSGLVNLGLEAFWLMIVMTAILLVAGMVVRWTQ